MSQYFSLHLESKHPAQLKQLLKNAMFSASPLVSANFLAELELSIDSIIQQRLQRKKHDEQILKITLESVGLLFGPIACKSEDTVCYLASRLKTYINSPWTLSYDQRYRLISPDIQRISLNNVENHDFYRFNFLAQSALAYLRQTYEDGERDFQKLLINMAPDSDFCRLLCRLIPKSNLYDFLPSNFEIANLSIGGQIKLHPPNISDGSSTRWHFDGDHRFAKIILYLDSVLNNDGAFSLIEHRHVHHPLMHISFWLQSITSEELLESLSCSTSELRLNCGFASQSSHIDSSLERLISINGVIQVDVERFSGVLFHGTRCLHKGGDNRYSFRPVFQGMLGLQA